MAACSPAPAVLPCSCAYVSRERPSTPCFASSSSLVSEVPFVDWLIRFESELVLEFEFELEEFGVNVLVGALAEGFEANELIVEP